jgi:PAS domain S-box-containing protein
MPYMPDRFHDPVQDADRIAALQETGLLDSAPEESFDRLARLAARLARAPVGLVNLVAADRQFSKSCVAPAEWPNARDLPLEHSFCKHAIRSGKPLLITDARTDPRVAGSRVVSEAGVRSYAGVPLVTAAGHALGTLCVADFTPREWSAEVIDTLVDLAAAVTTEIELRRSVRETEAAERLTREIDEERQEKSALLASTTEGIYGIDPRGRCTFINPAGAQMLGFTVAECLGEHMHRLIHHSHADGSPYPESECPIYRAYRDGREIQVEDEVLWRSDGSRFAASYSSAPIREGDRIRGAVVTFRDISRRRRAEETQRFFSRASKVLAASSLDYTATLRALVQLAAPALADWCSLHMLRPDGEIERLEIAHADPASEHLVRALAGYPVDVNRPNPATEVLKTGEPVLIPEIAEAMLESVAQDPRHLELLRAVGMRSGMVVPLIARGRILGSLTCISTDSTRPLTGDDLDIAQEFANRAALAVDNARLFHESEQVSHSKSEFLATVSHELRTPLNAVIGYTQLMLEGVPEPLPEGLRRYTDRISLSARHLLDMIEEILSFARLETGGEPLRLGRVELREVTAEVDAIAAPLAAAKGLHFAVRAPEAVELHTDLRKLRQILRNLVDNAIKFTDRGSVVLEVEQEGESVLFHVTDTGIGIAPADRDTIFEPFRQLEQSSTRVAGGTGLGLSLTGRLVRLLGGTLQLESEPGQGSRFTVCLPLAPPVDRTGTKEIAR